MGKEWWHFSGQLHHIDNECEEMMLRFVITIQLHFSLTFIFYVATGFFEIWFDYFHDIYRRNIIWFDQYAQ